MINNERWILATNFLNDPRIKNILSPNMQAVVNAKRVKLNETELYIRYELSNTPSGEINLLQNVTQRTLGTTNFDGNRLNQDRYFIWDGITINYGTATAGTPVNQVNYISALPAALKASDFIFKQEGVIVNNLAVTSINAAKSSDAFYRELGGLKLVEGDHKTIEPILAFVSGTDFGLGANNPYVEILMRGFETVSKR